MTAIGKQYGQALYTLAQEEQCSDTVLQQLQLLSQCFQESPEYLHLLSSPSLSKQERCDLLESGFRDKIHPYLLNFLKLLTQKGYIRHFDGCVRTYTHLYNQENGILPVTAVTATALTQVQSQRLQEKLSSMTGKTILLHNRVDPRCLGGVRLEYDGKCIDDTLSQRLDNIRQLLKETVI